MTEATVRYGACGHPVLGRGLTSVDGSLWCYECGREEESDADSELVDFVVSTTRYVAAVGSVLPVSDSANAFVDRLLQERQQLTPSRPLTRRKSDG